MSAYPAPWPFLSGSNVCRKSSTSLQSAKRSCANPRRNYQRWKQAPFFSYTTHEPRPTAAKEEDAAGIQNALVCAFNQTLECEKRQGCGLDVFRTNSNGLWRRRNTIHKSRPKLTRSFFTSSQFLQQAAAVAEPTQDELMGLMDFYHSEEAPQPLTATSQPVQDDNELIIHALQNLQAESDQLQKAISNLELLLADADTPASVLIEAYEALPSPGAARLEQETLLNLLNRLTVLPHKSEAAMFRYLNIVTDMRAAGKHVPVSVWTTAISFAGRCVKRISGTEIEAALALWKQMESTAGLRANEVTFNVLFDIAAKSQKFVLAEMLLQEMKGRGHRINRYARTSIMYYYGLRGDGAGVRRSYRELVEAGEIVDTAVMSCAVASLLKAGEPVAAEQVFERAKRLHAAKGGSSPLPPHGWRERRELGSSLNAAALRCRKHPEMRKQAQDKVSLAPGVQVYKVLVYHYAVKAGDIDRVSTLVDEMVWYQIPVQGAIFLYLFKGFAIHGGLLYSGWTRRKLEMTFNAFVGAIERGRAVRTQLPSQRRGIHTSTMSSVQTRASTEQTEQLPEYGKEHVYNGSVRTSETDQADWDPTDQVYVSRAAAELCLSAFVRVSDATRASEVWAQLQLLWKPSQSDNHAVEAYLVHLEEMKSHQELKGPLQGQRARKQHFWLR